MKQRTYVYVDGFNLYYGCLRKSPYKWLDLKSLFSKLLNDSHEISKIKYFTALISSREGNENARLRQKIYLKALQQFTPEIEIHYGHYLTHEINVKLVNPKPGASPFAKAYKTEEKGSDVNLASHLINDSWHDRYDCAVLVSNDSDLAEPLKLVKAEHHRNIGVIFPSTDPTRKPSRQLCALADFIKPIRQGTLAHSQLPLQIPNGRIFKPIEWEK